MALSPVLLKTAQDLAVKALAEMRGGPLLALSPQRSEHILTAFFLGALQAGRESMATEIVTMLDAAAAQATTEERKWVGATARTLRSMYLAGEDATDPPIAPVPSDGKTIEKFTLQHGARQLRCGECGSFVFRFFHDDCSSCDACGNECTYGDGVTALPLPPGGK